MSRNSPGGSTGPVMVQKVLVIDDEEIVLDSCTDILRSEPLEVATANGGAIGLERAEEFDPDLVLLDLKMPGLSGMEVLARLRDRDPSTVVVVITGYATVAYAVEAMKEGAYDFIPKPFTPDQLRLVVRRGLERRSLAAEMARLRREKEMLRENFAAICAHELKSPLGAVKQNLLLLGRQLTDRIDDEQMERLERMNQRIGELIEMIDNWLRSVSVDIEGIRDRFSPVPLSGPIEWAVESVEPHAIRKDIEILATIADPALLVMGDATTLAEAFTNMIGNAVKYSYPGGSVTVIASVRGDRAAVEIADSGIGISEDDRALIFEDFYRGREAGPMEQGVGLGLAITHRIIRAHGGSISVESSPGKGSTFTILLPVAGQAAQQDPETVESETTP